MESGAPHPGAPGARRRTARLGGWLAARFGPGEVLAAAAFSFAAQVGGGALAVTGPLPLTLAVGAGAVSSVLLALYLRAADDLKDWETDRRLASEGDDLFRGRPQVRGEVTEADLRALKAGVAAAFGLLLAFQPWGAALLGGLSFAGAWLSSHWFFHPAMARSLPLSFATHNPLALLFLAYAVAVGAGAAGGSPPTGDAALLVAGLYLPIAAWEIARKVRAPASETSYATWSSVLGWRAAAILPALLVAASAALLAGAGRRGGLGGGYPFVVALSAFAPSAAAAAFLARPSVRSGGRMRFAVEGYSLTAGVGLIAFALAARGIVVR